MDTTIGYEKYFGLFQKNSNEKSMLLAEIVGEIKNRDAKSLLDIGAGDGKLAIPLSRYLEEFVAIEQNPEFVETLSAAGVNAVAGKFPVVKVDKKFDIVLCSHSIYFIPGSYESFVKEAWAATHPDKGIIIVVYRRGDPGEEWVDLCNEIGISPINPLRLSHAKIIEVLSGLGKVTERQLVSYTKTDSIQEMVDTLSFISLVRSVENQNEFLSKKEMIMKRLESKFKTKDGYWFPLEHEFVIVSH